MPELNELELVDAALEEGRVTASDPDDRLLQELALIVRDEVRPEPDPDFAQEMDAWAAGGFGGPRDPSKQAASGGGFWRFFDSIAHKLSSPYGIAGGGAVAAALVVAVVIATGGGSPTSRDNSSSASDSGGIDMGQETAQSSGGAAAEPAPSATTEEKEQADEYLGTAPAPPSQGRDGAAPGEENRRIARQAQITLETKEGELQSVADQIVQLTDRRRGFVLSSSVSDSDNGGRGDFQLRIPADQLQATLRELSELADVTARSQNGQDVTPEYVSATDRLQAARAERRGLLRRLAAADNDDQAQRLRDRLDQNAREINVLRSQVRGLLEQTNYSTVSVTLQEGDGKADKDDGAAGGGGTSDALDDSLGLLVGSFNWLLRALGVLIPVGIVGGTALWAGRTLRRRRREAVLF